MLLAHPDPLMRRSAASLASELRSLLSLSSDRPPPPTLADCLEQAAPDCARAAAQASAWPSRAPPLPSDRALSFEDLAARAGPAEGPRYAAALTELAAWVGVLCPAAAAFARAYASKRALALSPALASGSADPVPALLAAFRSLACLASALPPPAAPAGGASSSSLTGGGVSSPTAPPPKQPSFPSQLPSPTDGSAASEARGRELARCLGAALVAPNAPSVALAAAAALGATHPDAVGAAVDELGALQEECASDRPRHKGRRLVCVPPPGPL